MLLHSPVIITSRLLPGVQIGKSFVSIEYANRACRDSHRVAYRYYLDLELDGKTIEHEGDDIESGCNHSLANGLASLLCFMSACGESYAYAMRQNILLEDTECGDLFPREVAEWCYLNSDELSVLSIELEENPQLIEEQE